MYLSFTRSPPHPAQIHNLRSSAPLGIGSCPRSSLGNRPTQKGAMTAATGVVFGLLLATSTDGFVNPSISRISPLRQAESNLAPIPSKARLPSGLQQLPSSSSVSRVSCSVSRAEGGSARGALSMSVINVGVIGAGRCGRFSFSLCCAYVPSFAIPHIDDKIHRSLCEGACPVCSCFGARTHGMWQRG